MTSIINRSLTDIRMTYGWRITEDDVRLALHEAGHVVLALSLGLRVESVTIEPGDGFLGRCIRSLECREATAEDRVYVAVAGMAAERFGLFRSRDFFQDDRFAGDREHVEDAMPDATRADLARYIDLAGVMLHDYRFAVDGLAAALLRRRELDEAQIRRELRYVPNGDLLMDHWKRFPQRQAWTPPPIPSAPQRSADTQAAMIRSLEAIQERLRSGAGVPPKVAGLLHRLEAVTPRRPVAPSYRVGNTRVETRIGGPVMEVR